MENKKKIKNKKIKILPIGGLGEVGRNCYVVEYGEEIYIIDYGVIFPSKDQLKVDYIIPNYYYLKKNENKIKALIVTHGHEDHIGGIPFILKKLKIKNIYAAPIAKMMIEKKLKEHGIKSDIISIDDDSLINFGTVKVHTFRQNHSIPDSMGLFIETPSGNIVTTGDFKIDYAASEKYKANFPKMYELSKKGVLCLMSDSTNAMSVGIGVSENKIAENLDTLMQEANGRIFYTTFASNINRVQNIVQSAKKNNRKIAINGRSLISGLNIGLKTKYINANKSDFIELRDLNKYKDNEICVILTGSQGEELAALSRLANGMNVHVTLNENDTIVFASNPIPGNNYPIGKVIDALYKTNCKIILNRDEFKTHASGHATQEEQKIMLSIFNPKNFLPIHGTHNMLTAHKITAKSLGINEENIPILNNGDLLEFNNNNMKIIKNYIDSEEIHVSGNVIDVNKKNRNMYKIAESGILSIVSYYDEKTKKLITYPQITTRGYLVINKSIETMQNIQKKFIIVYNENIHESLKVKNKKISNAIKQLLEKQYNDVPLIVVDLIVYNKNYTNKLEKKEKNVY